MRRNPSEEQFAQVLESTLRDGPENNDRIPIFSLFECLMTYTFILIMTPTRTAVMFERINHPTASSGR
jgi:hypothetical protein